VKFIFQRLPDGTAVTNVDHKVVRHSPSGLEFSYAGSGPADLALNILLYFIPLEQANSLYQKFKWDVIANIPREGGELEDTFVKNWIRKQESEDV